MKKNIFAVCDLEVDYALNFMDYLNHKKNIPFEIQAFTNVESLIAYGKMNHIELLLISQKAMCRQVQELEIGKIVILSEGVHPPDLDRYPSVYKYQASSDVVREVMACYGAEKAVAPAVFPVLKKTTEIYAVYSPLGRCLKTSFDEQYGTDNKQSGFHSACTYARGHTRNCMGRLGKTDTGDCTSQ